MAHPPNVNAAATARPNVFWDIDQPSVLEPLNPSAEHFEQTRQKPAGSVQSRESVARAASQIATPAATAASAIMAAS